MPEGRVETRKAMKGTKSLKTLSEVQMQPHELTRVNPHGKGHISFKMKKKKQKNGGNSRGNADTQKRVEKVENVSYRLRIEKACDTRVIKRAQKGHRASMRVEKSRCNSKLRWNARETRVGTQK